MGERLLLCNKKTNFHTIFFLIPTKKYVGICLLTLKLVHLIRASKIIPSYYEPSLKYINILCFLIHIISSSVFEPSHGISFLIHEI